MSKMCFFPSRLVVLLAAVAAASASAQPQTIVFSKTADVTPDGPKPSLLPVISYHASDFNAPHSWFGDATPNLPAPRPQLNNAYDASVNDALDRRKNWTLLTPAQILGVQTPEQILGGPDKAGGRKLSLEEQFLLRENGTASGGRTNGHPAGTGWHPMDEANPLAVRNQPDDGHPFRQAQPQTEPGIKFFSSFLNASGSEARPAENQGSTWSTAFFQPSQPKPTTEQLADMERFRALMEPASPPDRPQMPTRFSPAPAPTPDPFLQAMPVVNPAGRGFAQLENSLSRPAGIQPLPGISTPPPAPTAARPSWQAQPPPWMTPGPPAHPNWNY